jgi:protein-S-isoprenylcysteine O-methyltransferase Ste14
MKVGILLRNTSVRVYLPPVLALILSLVLLSWLLVPFAPDSIEETTFVAIGSIAQLCCLWWMFFRYRRFKSDLSLKRTRRLLWILTAAILTGAVLCGLLAMLNWFSGVRSGF